MGKTEAPQALVRPPKEPGTTRFEMMIAFNEPQKWDALLKRERLKRWIPKSTPVPSGGRAITR